MIARGLIAAMLTFGWLFMLPVAAQPSVDAAFRAFVDGLRDEARGMGISDATINRELGSMIPDRSLPDLMIGADKPIRGGQAEFTKTPLEYLNVAYLNTLAIEGRTLAARHAATLVAIERELGGDRNIVLAIWGRETAFGKAKLSHHIIRVLATQAYLGRRKQMFRRELLFALKMVEDRILDPKTMRASWAGATGLTQFMPSEYYDLAYDMDKDGRRDIWNSIPDALASAANQLKAKGWTPGQPWGYEIRLAAAGSCLDEGAPQTQPLSKWIERGVARIDGKPFPATLASENAFVLAPGGAYGPTFLVFENFMVLKRYNFADLYAVFVGHLADRIGGGGDFVGRWTTPKMLTTAELEEIQRRLQAHGYAIEKIDGKAGMNTRNMIGRYQKASRLPVDCWPSATVLAHLRAAVTR